MDVLWDARKDQLRKARAADHDGRSASTFGGVISTLAMDCIARAGPHVENSGCPAGRSSVSFSVLYNLG
jgi:hypothetical protein